MNNNYLTVIKSDETDVKAISKLIELGRRKTYVTIDDILHFFPEAEQDVNQLEDAFAALLATGISYHDSSEKLKEPSKAELEEEEKLSTDDLAHIDTDDTIGLYLKEVSRVPLLTADELNEGVWPAQNLPVETVSPAAV